MKTVKKNNNIKRVKDDVAHYMVYHEGWEYCPKNLWKEMIDKPIKKEVVEEEKITDNMSDKKKRKMRRENKRKKHEANNKD